MNRLFLNKLKGNDSGNAEPPASIEIFNWLTITLFLTVSTLVIVLLFGASKSGKATIFIWILACLVLGAAIGFLFGIPKILQANQIVQVSEGATASAQIRDNQRIAYQQQVNTNLTEISDWLTKIIVGLGLVNLTKIPPKIAALANVLGGALQTSKSGSATPLATAFAYGTIISYTTLGFLLGYIATRLYLAIMFSKADKEALSLNEVAKKADEATGAAHSAIRKAEFALSQAPNAILQSQAGQETVSPTNQLDALVAEYNEVRKTMRSSDARTIRMTKIVSQMAVILKNKTDFEVAVALQSENNGKRLAGIVFLYVNPDYALIVELINTIITDPTPFGQYWAIQALGSLRTLRPNENIEVSLLEKLKQYYSRLENRTDRKYELGRILPELKTS